MKAFEARKGSIKPQYDSAIHDIQRAVGWGWKNTHVDIHGSLYPEVATMLAKDGYDVKIVTINNGTTSLYNEVSWENAAEGKEGTVTYEDETFPVAPETSAKIDELLKNVLGIEPEEEEDEENYSEEGNEEESEGEDNNEENDEDFDYSDFELEDENI